MFKKNGIIRQFVMAKLNEHIEKAEVEYENGRSAIVDMMQRKQVANTEAYKKRSHEIESECNQNIRTHLESVVEKVLGKVL